MHIYLYVIEFKWDFKILEVFYSLLCYFKLNILKYFIIFLEVVLIICSDLIYIYFYFVKRI